MGLAFNQAKGSAQKKTIDQYVYKNGNNVVRIVGKILPRYVYWVKGFNGKNIPFECLSYNRETETFDNKEKDWVQEAYPDLRCGWSYAINCIDPADGKVKVMNLKKKLTEQVMTAVEDLGDPTDPETGYALCFVKKKTGPNAYNVEYQFQPLKCKPCPLTDEEKALVAEATPIDEMLPRPTADAQKQLLDKIAAGDENEGADKVDPEIEDEFDIK